MPILRTTLCCLLLSSLFLSASTTTRAQNVPFPCVDTTSNETYTDCVSGFLSYQLQRFYESNRPADVSVQDETSGRFELAIEANELVLVDAPSPTDSTAREIERLIASIRGSVDVRKMTDQRPRVLLERSLGDVPIEDPSVYKRVMDMPRFPGCEAISDWKEGKKCSENKLYTFLAENLEYPPLAKAAGLKGTVVVRFIVREDGSLTDLILVRSPGAGMGAEALRLVRSMPSWTPGTLRGRPVSVRYAFPVRFWL